MKKITTLFKTMLLAAVVLVMAQGCIPTTPVGGNPTPNPNSQISYQEFNVSLEDSIHTSQIIEVNFNDISTIKIKLDRRGLLFLTDTYINIEHDSTVQFLLNRSSTTDIFGVTHYTCNYAIPVNSKINATNTEWNNGLSHTGLGGTFVSESGTATLGTNDLYASSFSSVGAFTRFWCMPQNQTFYISFRAPLISNPSKFAYGWLQLKSIAVNDGEGNYYKLQSLQLLDGAIETNVGEIYVGNH